MALCRVGAMSNLPNPRPFTAAPNSHTRLSWKPSLPLKKPSISGFTPGVPYYANLTIRFATSGETSSFTSQYVKDDPDGSVAESVQSEIPKQEEKYGVASYNKASNEDSLDFQAQLSKIFDQLGIECSPLLKNHILRKEFNLQPVLAISSAEEVKKIESGSKEKSRFRWVEIGSDITKEQKQTISQLPLKMTKRCKALMKQLICYSPEKGSVSLLLGAWVKSMKPKRADWLVVLYELDGLNNPLYFEVAQLALVEESFEANVRDYTKIIHGYAKQNLVREAENMLLTMKNRGFICDQVLLTVLIHMYSKAGNLKLAEDTFEELMLLGGPLDRRSYGSMIMAYIRAGKLSEAQGLLRVMEDQEVYAGREVYKALLRAYSMIGDSKGAQRVFDALQLAGIIPDAKICGLVVNAYLVAGQLSEACIAFENMRAVGIEPNDKCVALLLTAYEKENDLNKALDILIDLEKGGVMLGKEASNILAHWFRRLGVIEEVELVLREYKSRAAQKEDGEIPNAIMESSLQAPWACH